VYKKTVAIIGSGTMGQGIAYLFAKFNWNVTVLVRDQNKIEILDEKFKSLSLKEQKRNKLQPNDSAAALCERISYTDNINDFSGLELVVAAISEDVDIKMTLFKEIGKIASKDMIIASNTSSLSITELASVYPYPENVVGLHFFNPAPVMKLVETIKGLNTSHETIERVNEIALELKKKPIVVEEFPGFVVNRLLMPMINEAVNLLDCGIAEAKDIDSAMKLGANHPLGPLELADFIGIDVVLAILETLYSETGEHRYKPSYTLKKMCLGNKLGRKVSEGFYQY